MGRSHPFASVLSAVAIVVACGSIPALLSATPVAAQSAKFTLDPQGTKSARVGYMPVPVKLSDTKPAGIKKEPSYAGTPKYGTFQVGNGPKSTHFLALDEPEGGTWKIYVDMKGDGDLTGSGDGSLRWDGPGSFLYDANGLGQFKQLPDPALHKDDLKAATISRKPGDLFAADNKLAWDNVAQGGLGDCYFAASLSSVLFADHGGALTQSLIKPNLAAGKVVSYTVTFFQASGRKVAIEVDPDLPHDNVTGDVFYMSSTDNKPGYEEWAPSLVEKAYAKWHRSYNAIGNGGTAADVLFALTGKQTRTYSPKGTAVVSAVEAAGKTGHAQAACTFADKGGPVDYTGTGIHGDHCYTVRGIERSGNQVFVLLRNPWGPWKDTEPPDDGVQDVIFKLELSKFAKYYADVTIVQ